MKTGHTTRTTGTSIILLALVGASLAACSHTTTSNVAVGQISQGEAGPVLKKDYIIKDKSLAREIQIQDLKARLVGEFPEGLALVQNQKKHTVDFEYRFEWYDAAGYPVESNIELWTPDFLDGKESKWIEAMCPKANATAFKLMIRRPNPVEE